MKILHIKLAIFPQVSDSLFIHRTKLFDKDVVLTISSLS
jgi:hypothetical protein